MSEHDFRDSGITDKGLHASFDELDAPSPDTDPFTDEDSGGTDKDNGEQVEGDRDGDGLEDGPRNPD